MLKLPVEGAIRQVLYKPGVPIILVSLQDRDILIDGQGKQLASGQARKRRAWYWVASPENKDHLYLCADDTIQLFDWTTHGLRACSELVMINAKLPEDYSIVSIESCKPTSLLLFQFGGPRNNRSESAFYFCDAAAFKDLHQDHRELILPTEKQYSRLNASIEHFIGLTNASQLLYLDRQGWVWIAGEFDSAMYERFFFIPMDWLSASQKLIFTTLPGNRGDLVFVKGEELAIIKRGLEDGETLAYANRAS